MKLFDFAIIIALSSAFIRQPDGAEFYFKEKRVKFEDTEEGKILTHDFHFTNTGDAPLEIKSFQVECSCTKVVYPAEPIPPGQSGVVTMTFETEGKYGLQLRKIELFSNASKSPEILSFKVYVIPREH